MRTRCGYAGGEHRDPTYHDLGDHTEAFALDFDPRIVSYDELLAAFWRAHRPTKEPYSRQYMAAVFPTTEAQRERALASRAQIANAVTQVIANARFYLAEDYHQKYYLRHDRILMAELADYAPAAFVDSTAAARLNGYAGNHGTRAGLEEDLVALALSPAAIAHLRAKLGGNPR